MRIAQVLLFFMSAVACAVAAETRVALVMGNSTYLRQPLVNPTNDAQDVAKRLEELGFKVVLRTNATQRQMKQAVREFSRELRGADVGVFFYAGHGVQSRGRNFLIPINADIQQEFEIEDESVDANLVIGAMEEAQTRINIVILDACRDNPFVRTTRSTSGGLAQMEAAKGMLIAFATAPGSVAADGMGRNGVYTKHLLLTLAEPGDDIERIFKRVAQGVARETTGKQIPWINSSLTADFYLAPPKPRAAPTPAPASGVATIPIVPGEPLLIQIELTFWESVRGSTLPEDYEEYLKQYPDGRFAGIARNRVTALRGKK
jgi:uncharacterized caspase-like protein